MAPFVTWGFVYDIVVQVTMFWIKKKRKEYNMYNNVPGKDLELCCISMKLKTFNWKRSWLQHDFLIRLLRKRGHACFQTWTINFLFSRFCFLTLCGYYTLKGAFPKQTVTDVCDVTESLVVYWPGLLIDTLSVISKFQRRSIYCCDIRALPCSLLKSEQ